MGIIDFGKRFQDVHQNIILKTAVLREGLKIGKGARLEFNKRDDILWRGFHLFSYDAGEPTVYKDKVPMTFHLPDGCCVQIRTNKNSPYTLDYVDGNYILTENNITVASGLYYDPKPVWYDMKLENGTPVAAVVQGFSGEYMFTTINRYCEFWNTNEQCLFCDINATFKSQTAGDEDVVARLEPEMLANAIKIAVNVDTRYRLMIVISGGTLLKKYHGQTEMEFYCTRLNAIHEKLQAWIPSTFQIDPQDEEGWKKLHATGISSVQPNIEVWGPDLFAWVCPGKNHFIGWDKWIKQTIGGVDVFGRGMIQPNFVLGVEMAKPRGFEKVSDAVKSTAGGWDFLMSHGVLPRFNQWYIESGSAFANQEQPPFEFFIEMQKAYTELRWKHKFDPPFPSTMSRSSYPLSCLQDFEYYHGTGILSRKWQDEALKRGREAEKPE
jgi:hypothetical protein